MSSFLVFEGIDGAGKSSQIEALVSRLESCGRRVRRLVEPTDGPHGSELRRRAREGPAMTAQDELDLFLADRRENVSQNVNPALAAGEDVVQDRSYFSTAAYQAARPELGLTPDQIVDLHADWAPSPDLVLLLDLPVDVGLARVARRGAGDAFEEEGRQRRVRANFLALAERTPAFRRIDADRPAEEVAADVWAAVEAHLQTSC
ncbi:MAG: dTMP kinase [Planctomycetes bacterium]|nr:dTMP kinase [Planctomycetota bacterium]